jgi:magnesium chelatase subunit I
MTLYTGGSLEVRMSVTREPTTIGELKSSGYRVRPLREEMRNNLLEMIESKKEIFPGIIGYSHTVIPQVENALIAGHDLIFLGERGQAKSRIMRQLISFLDEKIPVIQGCEINDNPFHPICRRCRDLIQEKGDETAISWLPRDERFGEKLATPDVTMGDLIGDVDPIRVAEGRYLSDELTIHYGLIPRTNRGIFAINELPDLAERIQVGLFNLMEEQDVQIRGYRVRLPLDILLVSSANPEDYTNRGRIITPLKDRFGAQVKTHYPLTTGEEISIMETERRHFEDGRKEVYVPRFIKDVVAEVTHLARKSPDINQSSGVSVRVSIANYETVIANSIRRAAILKEKVAVPRISDLPYIHASTDGKIEMEGSFDDSKSPDVFDTLVQKAVQKVFNHYCSLNGLESVVEVFQKGLSVEVSDMLHNQFYLDILKKIPGVERSFDMLNENHRPEVTASALEFVLEGLYLNKRLSKTSLPNKYVYGPKK